MIHSYGHVFCVCLKPGFPLAYAVFFVFNVLGERFCFVDISGSVDNHILSWFFIIEGHYQSFVSIKETCVFEIYIYKKKKYITTFEYKHEHA